MERIGATEVRRRLSRLLDRVAQGVLAITQKRAYSLI